MPLHPDRPLVLGHRGAPLQVPENTMRGFRLAMALGADGVELDVQPAADGTPVVIHDLSLDRTTDRTGIVAALSWPAITGVQSDGEPVPRLEEAAAWAAESGAWVNVEIKSPGAESASVAAMEAAGVMARTVFSSFVPEVIAELRRVAPHAVRYFLTERWDDEVRRTVQDLGAHGVCPHHSIATPALLAELREAGLGAVVWTVDDPERIRELVRAGVDAVITNRPELAVAVLAEEHRKSN
jgi:glycerophosphoryl diester phosphodiesterase